jgi:hypothetical protein
MLDILDTAGQEEYSVSTQGLTLFFGSKEGRLIALLGHARPIHQHRPRISFGTA